MNDPRASLEAEAWAKTVALVGKREAYRLARHWEFSAQSLASECCNSIGLRLFRMAVRTQVEALCREVAKGRKPCT